MKINILSKLMSVIVPSVIAALMVLGIYANTTSKEMLYNQVATSNVKTLVQTELYLDQIVDRTVQASSAIVQNTSILYTDKDGRDLTMQSAMSQLSEDWDIFKKSAVDKAVENTVLGGMKKANKMIQSAYILKENSFLFASPSVGDEYYDQTTYKDIPGFGQIENLSEADKGKPFWVEKHKDPFNSSKNEVISLLRYMRMDTVKQGSAYSGLLILNLKTDTFDMITKKDQDDATDDSTFIMVLDHAGNVLSHTDDGYSNQNVSKESYFNQVLQMEDNLGSIGDYENTYYISYLKHEQTGLVVLSFTSLEDMLRPLEALTLGILIIGLVLVVVVFFIMWLMSRHISKGVKDVAKQMKYVENGDLTVRCQTRRRDELGTLARSFNQMVGNIETLISKTNTSAVSVENFSRQVLKGTLESEMAFNQINEAIENVSVGLASQVDEVDKSKKIALHLSDNIDGISQTSTLVFGISKEASALSDTGQEAVIALKESTQGMTGAIDEVKAAVVDLGAASKEISQIVKTIRGISEETDLLSLNSSIEAARAGEAGKGFAVVAEEIRKLATQSSKAAGEIDLIIRGIQSKVERSEILSVQVGSMNNQQVMEVEHTINAFESILKKMKLIEEGLMPLEAEMKAITDIRQQIMASIGHIQAISENSASATEEINAASTEQDSKMTSIVESVHELEVIVSDLKEQTKVFTVNEYE